MKPMLTVNDYRIFVTDDRGQRVLANMLVEGGFFKLNKTAEEQAVSNFLKIVLGKTGAYPIEGVSSIERINMFVRNFVRPNKKAMTFVGRLKNMKVEY